MRHEPLYLTISILEYNMFLLRKDVLTGDVMEIELKYLLKDRAQADAIFEDEIVKAIEDEKSFESVDMHSVYFDTVDHSLTKAGISVRVRKEGEDYVATMKNKGESENGMHRREEFNVRLDDRSMIESPDISIFDDTGEYENLLMIAGKDKLLPVLEMRFERREVRIDTGNAISVLSADDGEIIAGDKSIPLMELEIELYSGDEKEMMAFGEKLAAKYGLEPEDKSKFQRGYELATE